MSDQPETITAVLQLVSHLGGPQCTPDELQWAADIPAGKQLFNWLASQIPRELPSSSNHSTLQGNTGRHLETAVSPIALYPEERDALAGMKVSGSEGSPAQIATSYERPSQLRARTSTLESDAELLENHAARLKHRLGASKKSTKDLKEAIRTLRKQVQGADDKIQGQQVRLADLSSQTDGAIARVTSLALRTLQETSTNDADPIEAFKAEVAALSSSRAAVATTTKHLYQTLDESYRSFLNASIQHDAEVVQFKLKATTKGRDAAQKLVEAAYVEELEKMAKRIEGARGAEAIAQILDAVSRDGVADRPNLEVNVKLELELAGRLDRLALLRAQEQGLDDITRYMRGELVPRLQHTYDTLHAKSTVALETEAIVSALIEELEDVNDAVESTRLPETPQQFEVDDSETLLEAQIVELLKGYLSSETEKPVVLLNRSDIEVELSSLARRLAAARKAEDMWAAGLRSGLGELSRSLATLLSATYSNSPVNTSPPFAPSAAQVALQEDARAKAEELMSAAARLQKDSEMSSRDKRKLGGFVEKWARVAD